MWDSSYFIDLSCYLRIYHIFQKKTNHNYISGATKSVTYQIYIILVRNNEMAFTDLTIHDKETPITQQVGLT